MKVQHLQPREAQAITFYRQRMHMSISHIAEIVERSTRTVAKTISKNRYIHKQWDKRRWPNLMKQRGERTFKHSLAALSWFYSVWLDGLISDISLLTGKTAKGEPP